MIDGDVFFGDYNQHDERSKKNPFFDPELLSKNYMESKSSYSVYASTAIAAPPPLIGKILIWDQVLKDISAAFVSVSLNSSSSFSSLLSSTTGTSTVSSTAEREEQCAFDARLSSNIFSALDKVMTFSVMQTMDLRFAQLVVLGMESHGKSTLLERILKLVLFPKGKKRCTTAILRAKLRRGPATLASVSIRHRATLVERDIECDLPLVGLDGVVCRLMNKIANEIEHSLVATQHEVLIRVTREDLPNLDLVDLPGIVSMNDGSNRQDLAQATYKLAESVVQNEKEYSMFLLIVDVRTEVILSQAAELVRVLKVERQTIGVFTKVDMFTSADEDEDLTQTLITKLQDQNLLQSNGWLLCANREPPKDMLTEVAAASVGMTLEDYRFVLMAAYEARRLLADSELCCNMPEHIRKSQTGIPAIRYQVQLLFDDFLVGEWVPHCLTILQSRLNLLLANNSALGLPLPEVMTEGEEQLNCQVVELFCHITETTEAAAAETAPLFIHNPNYNNIAAIFERWPALQIQDLVMTKLKQIIQQYLIKFDLCAAACNNNDDDHDDDDSSY